MRKSKNFWTKEECAKEALKFKSKSQFIKFSPSAYGKSFKNGWLDEISVHMIRPIQHNKKWNYKMCYNEALKYSSRVDFQKKSGSAYISAHSNGWLNDICEHMVRPKQYNKIWNVDTCKSEALKYKTRSEFNSNSKGAYLTANKLGIINEICTHMEICGSLMLRSVYSYEFSDNRVYVGLTFNTNLRHQQHLINRKSQVFRHATKTGLTPIYKILTEYIDVYSAMKLEQEILEEYIKNGWIKLNIAKTGGIGWIMLPKEVKI